jgi:tetratricopeptide (TPR) repeat protein
MRSRTFIAVAVSLALALATTWPLRAPAQEPSPDEQVAAQARQHFEAGRNAFTAGNHALAISEWKAAQALRPSPMLDYNIGLAHEQLGHARVAIKYYQRFLQGMPNAPNRRSVEEAIARLEQRVAPQPPPSGANDPYTQGAPPEPPPQPPTAQPPPPSPQAPQVQPAPPPAKTARSLWWVPLVVIGGIGLVALIVVIAVYAPGSSSTTVVADHALATPPPAFTLFRF